MRFELADYNANEGGGGFVEGLVLLAFLFSMLERGKRRKQRTLYHVAKLAPLVEEVTVHIDAVRLREIFRDESSNGGEVLLLECMLILDVP